MNIRKVTPKDRNMLTALSRNIYREHYLHLWEPGGAEWYMEKYAYAEEQLGNELSDPNNEYFIAEEDGIQLGYLKLVLNTQLKGYENRNTLEVERIYIHKQYTGKGMGKQFMDFALQQALAYKKDMIFLKAMDSSTEAIAFYMKQGYTICGRFQLPMPEFTLMKEEYRGMVLMMREVSI